MANDRKTCSRCEKSKTKKHFYINRKTADGLNNQCRACMKEIRKLRAAREAKKQTTNDLLKTWRPA